MDLQWFKDRKAELGIRDDAIGLALGRDRSVANKLLNGKVTIQRQHLEGLAHVFQVTKSEIAKHAGIVDQQDQASDLLPSEDEIAEILAAVQAGLPASLPYSEWPRSVAGGLRLRLGMLLNDRSKDGKTDPQA